MWRKCKLSLIASVDLTFAKLQESRRDKHGLTTAARAVMASLETVTTGGAVVVSGAPFTRFTISHSLHSALEHQHISPTEGSRAPASPSVRCVTIIESARSAKVQIKQNKKLYNICCSAAAAGSPPIGGRSRVTEFLQLPARFPRQ